MITSNSVRKVLVILIFGMLIILSLYNQWNYNVVYFFKYGGSIFERLSWTDYQAHYDLLGPVFEVVKRINQLPEDAVLYFVPIFPDTPGIEQNAFWWWHLNHILRYFCYPRKVVILHFNLYGNNRGEYIRKYMCGKDRLSDAEWIKSRGITHLITYRNNTVSILPVNAPIDF